MADYTRYEAREWARDHLTGCSAVTSPTFTADLERLNEAAIRQHAEREGADLVLLSYPPQFWPTSEQEIYEWTRAICDATNLGAMLFPIPLWGFERVHPAGMSVEFVRHALETIQNIVAIKSEQGFPGVAGLAEMYHHFRDEVVISCPIESDAIPLMSVMDLQFSGTSNTHWMSDWYPTTFELARSGRAELRGRNGCAQPDALEVPGVAGRLQRRSAPGARDADPGPDHEVAAR